MASLVKSVMLKIVADDGDSEAKLDKITEKADELGRLHPDIKVKVDAAAASAKLAVLRKELKDTGNAAAGDDTSLKSRLMSLAGAGASITGIGDAMTAGSADASMFQKVMAGASLATGLLEPVMAGAVVATLGLSSGLVAAGAGLGVFGLVAKSNLTTATTAANAVQAAQIAYTSAVASGTSKATAYAAEQKAILTAYNQLSPAQIAMSKQIGDVQNAWQSFVQSNTAGVDKVMSQGIGLLPKLLKDVQPLLAPTEKALSGLVTTLGKGLDSSGFKSFMSSLAQNTGPAITKLGDAILHVVAGIGGILKAFMPASQGIMSGLDKMTAKFATWGETLSSHSGFQSLMETFKTETPLAVKTLENLAGVITHLGASMTGLSTASNSKWILQLLTPLSGLLDKLTKNQDLDRIALYLLAGADAGKKLKAAFTGISGALGDLDKGIGLLGKFGGAAEDAGRGAKIASAATKVWTGVQAAFDAVMAVDPIFLVIAVIALLVAAIVFLVVKCKPFRDFWIQLWGDVEKVAEAAWQYVVMTVDDGVARVKGILNWFGRLPGLFRGWWDDAVRAVEDATGTLTGFVNSIPGRILRGLGNLGSLLFSAGENLIMGLVHGIESMAMAPVNAMSSIVSDVRSLLPFSPAKKGPLSGSGSPDIAGRKIGQMLAAGIGSSSPAVAAAARRMAGSATVTAGGGTAGHGAAQQVVIQFASPGGGTLDAAFLKWLRNTIRVQGGNVQTVVGH